jgi:hypothetical protein
LGWGKITGGRPGPLGDRTRSCREGVRVWEGWVGREGEHRFLWGVPDPMPAIVRVPQSSGHLFAKPCLHGGGKGGGRAWEQGFCVFVSKLCWGQ